MKKAGTILILFVPVLFPAVCCLQNVLMILSDDLRPQIGAWSGPEFPSGVSPTMSTPNLDDLASRSLHLTRAYTQYAVCGPSRTSMMTGRRPDTTKVIDLTTQWRDAGGNFTSIPQHFKDQGYVSLGVGKIYHQVNRTQDPLSWSEEPFRIMSSPWSTRTRSWWSVTTQEEVDDPLPDAIVLEEALDALDRLAPPALSGEQQFFLGVGFYKPHLPFTCPERFFDLYPMSNISTPPFPYVPENMPSVAWPGMGEFIGYEDVQAANYTGDFNVTLEEELTLDLRRAYYACVSHIDDLVGQLVSRVDALGLANNTVIVFAGDHGFGLGENAIWGKSVNFEQSTHVPLLIHVPGVTDAGVQTASFAELVDVFPTLAEAAGLPSVPLCPLDSSDVPLCTEGVSLLPLAQGSPAVKTAAFVQTNRTAEDGTEWMGYGVRTDSFMYTEWPRFSKVTVDPPEYVVDWDTLAGVELYDHRADPEESDNRAEDPEYAAVRGELSTLLREGWRAALPETSVAHK